jgi:hypothetical protein
MYNLRMNDILIQPHISDTIRDLMADSNTHAPKRKQSHREPTVTSDMNLTNPTAYEHSCKWDKYKKDITYK